MKKNYIENFKKALVYPQAKMGLLIGMLCLAACFIVPFLHLAEKTETMLLFLFAIVACVEGDQYLKIVTLLNMEDEERKSK